MKEITRIHIAKTPYNIEIDAKKLLEKYLNDLAALGNDAEVIEDIELRIVELLQERSVKPEGTVAQADITAIKKQLGEPEEIADEPVNDTAITQLARKKLFRHPQRGILGGVASGLAEMLNINAAWVRIAIIILAFASFGTVLVAYAVAWLVIPPVRSAKDLLQLRGVPVTPAAIAQLSKSEGTLTSNRDKVAIRILTVILGLFATTGAITALFFTIFGGIHFAREIGFRDGWEIVLIILAVLSGLLLTVLSGIIAYAAFAQRVNRRIVIAAIAVLLAGMVTFGTLIGTGYYYAADTRSRVEQSMKTDTVALPDNFQGVDYLEISAPTTEVTYEVSKTPQIKYEYSTLDKSAQQPEVKVENNRLIVLVKEGSQDQKDAVRFFAPRKLTISGPELKTAQVLQDTHVTYMSSQASDLKLLVGRDASIDLNKSVIKNLEVYMQQNAEVTTELSSVTNVKLDFKDNALFNGGHIATMSVRANESCPANQGTGINLYSLSNPTWTFNGAEQKTDDFREACVRLRIESSDYDSNE